MAAAEGRAIERGCHSSWVDTFSFQAPGFYPKLGYEPFGELDYPPDFKRVFLQKRLAPGGATKSKPPATKTKPSATKSKPSATKAKSAATKSK